MARPLFEGLIEILEQSLDFGRILIPLGYMPDEVDLPSPRVWKRS
jgi:hypothetical protein